MSLHVLVSVGTDHHPFDRLVTWADRWAAVHPDAEVVIQFGQAAPPTHATARQLLEGSELESLMAWADVVVTHGGPATITLARSHGAVPLALGRDPRLGEHVDDHQQRFVSFLAERDLVVTFGGESELHALLDEAQADPGRFRFDAAGIGDAPPAGVPALGRLVATLVADHRAGGPPRAPEVPVPAPVATDGGRQRDVTVLFIGGQGRSGSTLIERAVAELPGAVGVGEVLHLWQRGLLDDDRCGCGERFHACPFWAKVGEVAFGGWDRVDATTLVDLRYAVDRNRYVPWMLRPGLNPGYDRQRARYTAVLGRLYRAIAEVSGASVIVDSGKHGSYAVLLRDVPGIDLRLLHVVRDAPAVAHAWTKQVPRPETDGAFMPTYGPVEASVLWNAQNVMLDLLSRQHPHVTVRYEDFVADPAHELSRVAALVADRTGAGSGEGWDFLDGRTLHLGASHSVAGNPMRFQHGDVTVRLDDSWRSAMKPRSRRLVEVLTAPVRLRHGYLRGAS